MPSYDVNISHKEATKGFALSWMLDNYGFDRADVMAVGDGINDRELFAAAGYRIATADAHPLLLAEADEVINAQSEDGLALLFERLATQ